MVTSVEIFETDSSRIRRRYRMTRNACINHPKDKMKEILIGTRYCERCHHLVPPELEITEIVQEMTLEEESEPSVEEMKEEVEKIIEDSNIPDEVKKDIVIEIVKEAPETPTEAELEKARIARMEDLAGITEAKKAEIASIRARLAELEKTEE